MSAIEDTVRALNERRAHATKIEDGMRQMRLGGKPELRFKRLWWRRMVIGGGWASQEAEPLSLGIETEFYAFLGTKAAKLAGEIRDIEASLNALTAHPETTGETA